MPRPTKKKFLASEQIVFSIEHEMEIPVDKLRDFIDEVASKGCEKIYFHEGDYYNTQGLSRLIAYTPGRMQTDEEFKQSLEEWDEKERVKEEARLMKLREKEIKDKEKLRFLIAKYGVPNSHGF